MSDIADKINLKYWGLLSIKKETKWNLKQQSKYLNTTKNGG